MTSGASVMPSSAAQRLVEAVQRDAAVGRGTRACYGCSSRLVMHAMELVERLASRDTSRRLILEEGLLSDVLGGIMQTGSAASRRQARAVACLLVRDDATLTDLLLREGVLKKVEMCLQHSRALDLNLALRNEMQLLAEACQQAPVLLPLPASLIHMAKDALARAKPHGSGGPRQNSGSCDS